LLCHVTWFTSPGD